jgi:nucleolar pre-ribosomal-associated protein 2
LLNFLLRAIPLSNAARILSERQFLPILRRTLDEATKVVAGSVETISSSDSTVANIEVPRKVSKKRKRSGVLLELVELVATSNVQLGKLPTLMDAIFVTMEYLVQSTKLAPEAFEEGRAAAFSAEYMKNVIRTTASQSAIMLSSWFYSGTKQKLSGIERHQKLATAFH